MKLIFVTESGKTGLIHTSTEIQFLSISERYTHALPRNTKHLAIDGHAGLLLQTAFCRCCKATKVHVMVLGRVNRTAWGTKLLLTAVWASLVDCTSPKSLTEGTPLLFESEWVLYPAFGSPPAPTTHPTPLPPAHPL